MSFVLTIQTERDRTGWMASCASAERKFFSFLGSDDAAIGLARGLARERGETLMQLDFFGRNLYRAHFGDCPETEGE